MKQTTRLVEVVDGVWVATSTWFATTSTVLLDSRGGAVVVDPAFLPDELAAIPRDLDAMGVRCVAGVSTHEHYDHVLWHDDLGDVPRWSSPGSVAHLGEAREVLLAPLAEYLSPDLIEIAGRLRPLPDSTLPWSGPVAVLIEHDAHAPAHVALWIPDRRVLVAGDMLSDVELPMPADDESLEHYAAGLERLREAVNSVGWLVPGHGTVTSDAVARYDADRRYLDDLLTRGGSDDPRVGLDGMPELHEANLARARAGH